MSHQIHIKLLNPAPSPTCRVHLCSSSFH